MGKRPGGNMTRVVKLSDGRYRTSIPRAIAEAYEMEGATLEWKPLGKDRLEVRIVRRREEER